MRLHHSRTLALLAILLTGLTSSVAPAPRSVFVCHNVNTDQISIEHQSHSISNLGTESSSPRDLRVSEAPLAERADTIYTQQLTGGWLVRYAVFSLFAPIISSLTTLAKFWARLAVAATIMPNEEFEKSLITFRFGGLRIELCNIHGAVPRVLVSAVANAMLTYTNGGFCGVFNAKTSAPGYLFWVSMFIDNEGSS